MSNPLRRNLSLLHRRSQPMPAIARIICYHRKKNNVLDGWPVRNIDFAHNGCSANLLKIYESELDNTYIAWTGSGTAGDASTFLNSNSNYARIDGPSVWLEFACQGGS